MVLHAVLTFDKIERKLSLHLARVRSHVDWFVNICADAHDVLGEDSRVLAQLAILRKGQIPSSETVGLFALQPCVPPSWMCADTRNYKVQSVHSKRASLSIKSQWKARLS